jgi:hypothetical protein
MTRTVRRLLTVTGATIIALVALTPVALAGSDKGFHLDKTCGPDPTEPLGYVCTIRHADFKWFPAGTKVHYLSQTGNVVQARIEIKNGSTNGACTWSSAVDAICVFSAGTGRLTQFNLEVVVSFDADQSLWYWDGSYSFGN